MEQQEILSYYKGLVPFIHAILGPDSEVLLHDISQPDSSILEVAGNLSRRKKGGPLTNMALKQIKDEKFLSEESEINYQSYTLDHKVCRSSSYFIKDNDGKLIGLLCVNILVSDMLEMRDMLDKMIGLKPVEIKEEIEIPSTDEQLGQNLDELMTSLIDSVLDKYDIDSHLLSIEEREFIISELNDKGVFLLKGGVAEVAKAIDMSESSVYRYLSKIK